jgi:hypothetical protein
MPDTTTRSDLSVCAHHWMLGIPGRGSTMGTCKLCGVTREFNDAYQAPSGRTPRAGAKKSAT